MGDTITITILDDGTIKTETDKVSMPNHMNAEGFLRDMGKLAGGEVKRKIKVAKGQIHVHDHEHGGQTHQH